MSRQELAAAVNAHVFRATGRVAALDAHYIGRLERGQRCWPMGEYRDAFRTVLGATTDAELGFYVKPRGRDQWRMPSAVTTGRAVRLVMGPGMTLILVAASRALLAVRMTTHGGDESDECP